MYVTWPHPGACSLHLFYNRGLSIFNKYLGYTGAGGSLVHTLKMTGLYLEPTSGSSPTVLRSGDTELELCTTAENWAKFLGHSHTFVPGPSGWLRRPVKV